MTKLATRPIHRAGLTGGVLEGQEPDLTDRQDGVQTLASGVNLDHQTGGRLGIPGGSKVQRTLALHAIDTVLGVWPFSPCGMIVMAHDSTGHKTYAYALTDDGEFALPVGTETETGSIVDVVWDTTGPHRPDAVELFERLYIVDATISNREALIVLEITGGALVASKPAGYDFNQDSTPGVLKPYCCEAYNGHLFIFGTDSEAVTTAPAYGRHSFLGIEPGQATGFDKDAYNIFGATGQWVRAAKAGNSVLLVAKDNELYRVSGSGRGVPGWQFAVQPVDNSLGFGCSNPYALCHVNGYWYGLGTAGPWRSDGQTVQSLLPPRTQSWAQVDQLEVAQVVVDPDRRCVLFGFHLATEPTLPDYPFVYWRWHVDDEVWAPNRRFKSTRAFPMIRAIPQTAGAGPSTIPSGLTQSRSYGNMAYRSIDGYFAPGDLTAMTEVWMRSGTNPSVLTRTLDAGVSRFSISVQEIAPFITVGATAALVKVRQVKAGVYTDFTAETEMFTRLRPPFVTVGPRSLIAAMQADVTNTNPIPVDVVFRAADGVPEYDSLDETATLTVHGLSGEACISPPAADFAADWEAWVEHTDWPAPFDVSDVRHSYSYAGVCTGSADYPPRPTQDFYSTAEVMAATSISLEFRFCYPVNNFRVEYRLVGAGSYTVWSTETQTGAVYEHRRVTITGLTANSRYEVRLNNVSVGRASLPTTMYTKLGSPTLTANTNGSMGLPSVQLVLTAPYASASVQVYNARETHAELLTGIGTSPSTTTRTWGSDGVADVFYARVYNSLWPEPYRYSDAVSDGITDPATIGT